MPSGCNSSPLDELKSLLTVENRSRDEIVAVQEIVDDLAGPLPGVLHINDWYGCTIDCISAESRRFGYTTEFFRRAGPSHICIFHPDDSETNEGKEALPVMEQLGSVSSAYRLRTTAGWRWLYGSGTILTRYDSGDVRHMLGHAVDITDCLGLRHVADFIQDLLRSDADGKVEQLTRREREILDMIGSGLSDARIADRLSLSVHTVSTHRRNILRKMGAPNAAALVHTAISRGITSFDTPKTNGIITA